MTLQEYLQSLRGRRLAVIGIGVSNQPLLKLLLEAGLDVTACDRKDRTALGAMAEELERAGCALRLGADYLEGLDHDVIFRTPGLHPRYLEEAKSRGSTITSEMEVFFEVCPCPILAVTGSDGKTTTTTIIARLLERAGHTVHLGGNIGRPLLSEAEAIRPTDWAVVELSSFQLLTMERSPQIAVLTNLAPNHLDVHTDMDEYIRAKSAIFAHQGPGDRAVFNLPLTDILLPGSHNVENYMAAVCAVQGLVPDAVIRDFARTFGGVEHRIELVRERRGVRWFNDSIASSPSRTMAGLRAVPEQVILNAGGKDKGVGYAPLGPVVNEHVKLLILCGATAGAIRAAAEQAENFRGLEIAEVPDYPAAVSFADRRSGPGDVVLLSPASTSFDRFRNFEERGRVFKDLVNALPE